MPWKTIRDDVFVEVGPRFPRCAFIAVATTPLKSLGCPIAL